MKIVINSVTLYSKRGSSFMFSALPGSRHAPCMPSHLTH